MCLSHDRHATLTNAVASQRQFFETKAVVNLEKIEQKFGMNCNGHQG